MQVSKINTQKQSHPSFKAKSDLTKVAENLFDSATTKAIEAVIDRIGTNTDTVELRGGEAKRRPEALTKHRELEIISIIKGKTETKILKAGFAGENIPSVPNCEKNLTQQVLKYLETFPKAANVQGEKKYSPVNEALLELMQMGETLEDFKLALQKRKID